jgi:hypothetical protein
MGKTKKIIPYVFVAFIIVWLIMSLSYFMKKENEVSELNKKIDAQEKIIAWTCWICMKAKSELKNLYSQKTDIMSGFILEAQ